MIYSSLSASTASVFNRSIRSCLKPFSAVLPLKTRSAAITLWLAQEQQNSKCYCMLDTFTKLLGEVLAPGKM